MPRPARFEIADDDWFYDPAVSGADPTQTRPRFKRLKGLRVNPHIPLQAAANAVWQLRKELSYVEAETFAQKAVAWVVQAHNAWFWRRS